MRRRLSRAAPSREHDAFTDRDHHLMQLDRKEQQGIARRCRRARAEGGACHRQCGCECSGCWRSARPRTLRIFVRIFESARTAAAPAARLPAMDGPWGRAKIISKRIKKRKGVYSTRNERVCGRARAGGAPCCVPAPRKTARGGDAGCTHCPSSHSHSQLRLQSRTASRVKPHSFACKATQAA